MKTLKINYSCKLHNGSTFYGFVNAINNNEAGKMIIEEMKQNGFNVIKISFLK